MNRAKQYEIEFRTTAHFLGIQLSYVGMEEGKYSLNGWFCINDDEYRPTPKAYPDDNLRKLAVQCLLRHAPDKEKTDERKNF